MKVIDITYKQAEKKAQELRNFLFELDSISELLYNRLDYDGVWDTILELENVRVRYYTEWFEYDSILRSKGQDEK